MIPADRTAWVVDLDVDCFAKAVLHVMAHRANGTTLKSWITIDRLAKEAGMSPTGEGRHLAGCRKRIQCHKALWPPIRVSGVALRVVQRTAYSQNFLIIC